MKIQYQLWLIFSGLFIAVCISLYMFIFNTYEQRLQGGYEQISITQGSAILEEVKDTYPYSPNRSRGYLQTYGEQIDGRLIILDQDKRVYVDSFEELQPNTALNLPILDQGHDNFISRFSKTEAFGYVQYTLLPFQRGGREGYLLIVQEADELYDELKSFKYWMMEILLMAVFIFFFISYFASNWFTKPIRQIIFHLKKITPKERTFTLKYHRRDENKELIHAIQNMIGELNLYDQRQRRFLSTSSHELKTPLATMQLILENLPYVRKSEETHIEFVQDLSFQVEKMKRIVEQLLQLNRIWDKNLLKETLSGEEIRHHILQSFQYIAKDKKINLEFEIELVELYVNRELFLHGLDNLISNAIRYSPQNQCVKIKIKRDKEQIKISICDQGIGISPEELPHIFEPFYRSNDATSWNQEGSGLGLAIVKQMVDIHKGSIEIDTVQNQGTCIHLFL